MDGRHRAKDLHRVRQVPQARLTVDLGAPFAVPLPRKGNGAGSRVLFGEGKPDLKAGVTRFGLNLDVAAMLFHDPLHGVEAESSAFPYPLRGEEWLEDVREHVRRNSGT